MLFVWMDCWSVRVVVFFVLVNFGFECVYFSDLFSD